jgi:hypothetical protein
MESEIENHLRAAKQRDTMKNITYIIIIALIFLFFFAFSRLRARNRRINAGNQEGTRD